MRSRQCALICSCTARSSCSASSCTAYSVGLPPATLPPVALPSVALPPVALPRLLLCHAMRCSTFCPCFAARAWHSRRSVALIPRRPLPLLICCAAFTAAAAIAVLMIRSGCCFGTASATARVALAQGQSALLCSASLCPSPRRSGAGGSVLWYAMLSDALPPVCR